MNYKYHEKILDLSAPIYYLVSDLEQNQLSCTELMDKLISHINKSRKEIYSLDVQERLVEEIVYATSALADEIIMRSNWLYKSEWAKQPLCIRLFGDAYAGKHFFKRIESLREAPITNSLALWHYLRCIQLGFEGQYRGSSGSVLKDIQQKLDYALVEAGFSNEQKKAEPILTVAKKVANKFTIKMPLHGYLLIGVFLLPLAIFIVYDLFIYNSLNEQIDLMQGNKSANMRNGYYSLIDVTENTSKRYILQRS